MPAIKPNPQSSNDPDRPIWGAKAIAEEINRPERAVYYLIENGLLDTTKVGAIHTSTPRRLRRSLGAEG
jgi:hypothetical protein